MFVYIVLAFAAVAVVAAVLASTKTRAARAAEAPLWQQPAPPHMPDGLNDGPADGLNGLLHAAHGLHGLAGGQNGQNGTAVPSPTWEPLSTAPSEWWGQWTAL